MNLGMQLITCFYRIKNVLICKNEEVWLPLKNPNRDYHVTMEHSNRRQLNRDQTAA